MFSPTLLDVKEYWNRRPCNIRHSTLPVGTMEYFDEVERRKYFVEPHILEFAAFSRWTGKTVLEIGCGIGTDTINFARAGATVTAVELSEESLDIAKQRAKVFGLENRITFYTANAEELPKSVPIKAYDIVYSFGVIHHTPDPRKAIEQMMKYMGPNSEMRIMVYAKYSWKNFLILIGLAQPEAQTGCPIAFTYRANDVCKLLNGMKVLSIKKDHIFPYVVDAYKQFRYVWAFPWVLFPRKFFRWCERIMGWHLLVVSKLDNEKNVH